MTVKPFKWTGLKKVLSRDASLIEAVSSLIPAVSGGQLGLEIRKMLMKHLGEKSFYYLDDIFSDTYASFLSGLPDFPVMALIGLEPSSAKMVVHIDTNLSFLLISRLLGGAEELSIENRVLSETEQGVLQYLVMQVLAQVWFSCGKEGRLHFRFEKFSFSGRDIEKLNPAKESVISCVFKVGIGDLSGFIKVVLPAGFIEKTALVKGEDDYKDFLKRLDNYDYIRTTLWAEGGRATVSSQELVALEEGDVVIFEETSLALKDNVIGGEVDLRAGRGEGGSLRAGVITDGSKIKCTII